MLRVLGPHRWIAFALPLIGCLLTGLGAVGLGALALRFAVQDIVAEREQAAIVIGLAIKRDMERAFAIGIPFNQMVGVPEYFGGILDQNKELRYVAALAPDNAVVFREGISLARLKEVIDKGAVAQLIPVGSRADLSRSDVEGFSNFALKLNHGVERVGTLIIATQPGQVVEQLSENLRPAGLLLLVALAIGLVVALDGLRAALAGPLDEVSGHLGLLARPAFGRLVASGRGDELARCQSSIDRLQFDLYDRYQRLVAYATEVTSAMFDPAGRAGAQAVRAEIVDRFGPGLGRLPVKRDRRFVRDTDGVVLLLAGAAGLGGFALFGPLLWPSGAAGGAVLCGMLLPLPRAASHRVMPFLALVAAALFGAAAIMAFPPMTHIAVVTGAEAMLGLALAATRAYRRDASDRGQGAIFLARVIFAAALAVAAAWLLSETQAFPSLHLALAGAVAAMILGLAALSPSSRGG